MGASSLGLGITARIRAQRPSDCARSQCSDPTNQPNDRTVNRSAVGALKEPHRPRLLWIDDEKSSSDLDIKFLKQEGLHVDCATTGTEGLALARIRHYQLILLDLNLPDIPGLSVLATLRADQANVPVLVVTGFGDFESARVAGELGAVGFEGKPVFVDALKVSIERALGIASAPNASHDQRAARESDCRPATLRSLALLIETLYRLTLRSAINIPDRSITREAVAGVLIRGLLDSALPMRAFLACAEALKRTVTTDPAESAYLLAEKAQTLILQTLGRPKPKNANVIAALAMLESAARDYKRLPGAEVANLEAVSQSQLSGLVYAETGFYFTQWRSGYLLRPSVTLLAETEEHVKQIACRQLRFSQQSQFNHEFKALFGLSPIEFRKHSQRNLG